MKIFILNLCLALSLLSQKKIEIYINQAGNKFNLFEIELVQEIIKLHNARTASRYQIEFKSYNVFSKLFEILDEEKSSSNVCGINKISITKERSKKYHFSAPYFVSKLILLSKKYKTLIITDHTRLSYTRGTLNVKIIELLKKKNQFKAIPYEDFNLRYKALMELKDDYGVADYIDPWVYNMNLVKVFDEFGQDHYGIIFPKNSNLARALDKTIAYYVRSPAYYELVRKHFGKLATNFVKQNL